MTDSYQSMVESIDNAPISDPIASVRLRGVKSMRTTNDDGEPVLIVSDGETTIEFGCGLCGPTPRAAEGAKVLATAMVAFAADVSRLAGVPGPGFTVDHTQ